MKKFGEYLSESLTAELTQEPEPSSATAIQARKMNLTYVGFGRYEDQTGRLAYIVKNNQLIPFRGKDEVAKIAQTANDSFGVKDEKLSDIAQAAEKGNSALKEVDVRVKRYIQKKEKELNNTAGELANFYKPNVFTPEELDSLNYYTEEGYGPINRYLYKGFDDTTTPEDAQNIVDNIENIDSAFDETGAPFDYTVYTALSQRYDYNKIKPGSDYIFRGYISTSLDHNVATDLFMFMNDTDPNAVGTLLEIDIKTGQKSIYMENISYHTGEFETLLPRGTKLKIVSGPHMVDHSTLSGSLYKNQVALFKCSIVDE